jgi:hypothetical protein
VKPSSAPAFTDEGCTVAMLWGSMNTFILGTVRDELGMDADTGRIKPMLGYSPAHKTERIT